MAKRKISPQFRARLSEKLMELGNLVAITLAVGQFISSKEFSWELFTAGITAAIFCYIASYIVSH